MKTCPCKKYGVFKGGMAIGVLCVRCRWLRGPYIELLGLDENHQGQGIGSELLAWIEQETKPHANNIWVATSAFNTRAITIYERFGFTQVGLLDGLVMDGKSEVLMRKRLPRKSS